ncbi:MAG: hypothetical protein A2043_09795 [Candidatus Schekmanbacteria bacterium GWA2_38_9]|uniref:Cytochrome c domain-containing protein n=1 Tax=Candidatus Schekmanbacteria bacterium RIFCSPLOWO2_12_FULL_38_15 TaxID=1817883 RepID=A0A1F7SEK7_9BACT|nr:MAG: hypothetical protein A2043_09795 [Candidatus Schekmanbacteria bacterium GWA2_38_9]OGL49918.1 MAG: hypothetical protein A3H37_09950 [Candidatus Schekmanbacteria bacterium RIFCSPLOWO2_02_FULL_38_14]OGL52236.1 MAG: hypothetical protein A3G31_02990 [Candidatus Schekmanbacteria bacterium RIFCSPLOWO2_12_FULL_38_15]
MKKAFVISTLLLVLTFLWSLEDDYNREWKKYQREFKSMELKKNDKAKEDVFQRVKGELGFSGEELKKKGLKREKLLKELNKDVAYKKLVKEQWDLEYNLYKKDQAYQFAKSEYDAVKYFFEKLKDKKKETSSQWKAMKRWKGEMTKSKPIVLNYEKSLEGIKEKIKSMEGKRGILSETENKFLFEIEQIEKKKENIKKEPIAIKQVLLDLDNDEIPDKVDRCISCHLGIDKAGFEEERQPYRRHPNLRLFISSKSPHPLAKFGCTICHEGQGPADSFTDASHTPSGETKKKQWKERFGWKRLEHWEYPQLSLTYIEASCYKCHEREEELIDAPYLNLGRSLFEKRGCYGCHNVKGFEKKRKIGPPLLNVTLKTNEIWIFNWLLEPKNSLASPRMPTFKLNSQEIFEIIEYLKSINEAPLPKYHWDPYLLKREDEMSDMEFNAMDLLYQKGKGLWGQSRCAICHSLNGLGGAFDIGPDLGNITEKIGRDWLYSWIKEPKKYFLKSIMPRYRFTDGQIRALIEFIMRDPEFQAEETFQIKKAKPSIGSHFIDKGRGLIRRYGCSGCHDIKGMEKKGKVGAELSNIGDKAVDRLDFALLEGKMEHTLDDWLYQKLKDPRIFDQGKVKNEDEKLKMPYFNFNEEELKGIVTFLLGLKERRDIQNLKYPFKWKGYKPSGDFGLIAEDINCLTCHKIRGVGANYAPDLTYVGSKAKREWLKNFLSSPNIIRPLLQQMPQFNISSEKNMIQGNLTPREVETITDYIKAQLIDEEMEELFSEDKIGEPSLKEKGERLFFEKGCHTCHQMGRIGGVIGPDLTKAGKRLYSNYIYQYIKDPHRFTAQAAEPIFGLSEEEATSLTAFLASDKKKINGEKLAFKDK